MKVNSESKHQPRNYAVAARVSRSERAEIKAFCKKAGVSQGDLCRELILHAIRGGVKVAVNISVEENEESEVKAPEANGRFVSIDKEVLDNVVSINLSLLGVYGQIDECMDEADLVTDDDHGLMYRIPARHWDELGKRMIEHEAKGLPEKPESDGLEADDV